MNLFDRARKLLSRPASFGCVSARAASAPRAASPRFFTVFCGCRARRARARLRARARASGRLALREVFVETPIELKRLFVPLFHAFIFSDFMHSSRHFLLFFHFRRPVQNVESVAQHRRSCASARHSWERSWLFLSFAIEAAHLVARSNAIPQNASGIDAASPCFLMHSTVNG